VYLLKIYFKIKLNNEGDVAINYSQMNG